MKCAFRILAAVLLLFFGMLPSNSFAGNKASAIVFSPFAGGYVFEGNQHLKDAPVFGLGVAYNFTTHWAAEGVFTATPTETNFSGSNQDVDVYGVRLDVLYHFRPGKKLVPYLAAGGGGMFLDPQHGSTDEDFLVDYGAGLKYFITPDIALRADVRHIFDINYNDTSGTPDFYNNLSYTGGASFQFGGVEKAPKSEDSDGDGVIDLFDRCPGTPLGVPVDGFGCPADEDHDGVYDYLDKCPGTPAGITVDRTGCAVPVVKDSDGDGVADDQDKCPNTPAGVSVNAYGCPKDSDGDGVFDVDDKCPGTPAGTAVDSKGCPVPVQKKYSLALDVQFASGQATVRPEFRGTLEKAAQFIKEHPDGEVIVEGHTDSVGPAAYNLQLSQQRAESVRKYLIDNFQVDPNKITAKGYGEIDPVADNSTQEGRLKNRRVVITIERKP